MDAYTFRVGTVDCLAVNDGDMEYAATDYVVNAPAADVAEALKAHGHDPDRIPSPYSGLVVRTDSNLVLIDTGAGDLTPDVGRLNGNLRGAGIDPREVDTVVLSHGHPDHIGGTVDAAGGLAFPNARYVMFRAEWDYWTDETILAGVEPIFGAWARTYLLPLRDHLDLLDRETEIVPGVQAIEAPGHTIGQLAVAVRSGSEELLYISDAAVHPIHLEHPDWYPVWDLDPPAAVATRRRLFDRAASNHSLILAFHFPPFPSLGHVTKRGSGWLWDVLPVAART